MRVLTTIVSVESSNYYIFWECFFGLSYPAWNAHAPYYHLWPIELYSNFFHIIS